MSNEPRRPSRRSFLDWLLGAGVVGWMGSVAYPVLRYLAPLPESVSGGPLHLDAAMIESLRRERFTIVGAGSQRVLVFEDQAGTLRALDARCTHEGCTVQYLPGEDVVWCACHNARFDLDGRVVSGPPPRPLARHRVTEDEGGVVVTSEEA